MQLSRPTVFERAHSAYPALGRLPQRPRRCRSPVISATAAPESSRQDANTAGRCVTPPERQVGERGTATAQVIYGNQNQLQPPRKPGAGATE